MPHALLPPIMSNKGNYIVSLGNLCRWLAQEAEALGVEVYAGFSVSEMLYNEDGSVKGVATADMGVDRQGGHKLTYQPGMELHAKYTFLAEGASGSLSKSVIVRYGLVRDSGPQTSGDRKGK